MNNLSDADIGLAVSEKPVVTPTPTETDFYKTMVSLATSTKRVADALDRIANRMPVRDASLMTGLK